MNTFYRCKFFYLKEVTSAPKGEFPIYACEREHDISTECDKSCPDFQQIQTHDKANQLATKGSSASSA
jgi:hypothetical protein